MNTHESVICVDDVFTGTTKEVIEYLGFGTKSQISKCVLEKRRFRGHKIEKVGTLKHVMIYGVLAGSNAQILVDSGTAEELAEKYRISKARIADAARLNGKILGRYTITKIGMSDVLEEV